MYAIGFLFALSAGRDLSKMFDVLNEENQNAVAVLRTFANHKLCSSPSSVVTIRNFPLESLESYVKVSLKFL